MRKNRTYFHLALLSIFLPATAHAYIGPGAGVALIGTFFGFAAAVGASVLMVLAWPAWIIYKKRKQKKLAASQDNGSANKSANSADTDPS